MSARRELAGRRVALAVTGLSLLACSPEPPASTVPSAASGRLHVAPDGKDGLSCSADAPCGSLAEAYESGASSAVVEMAPGRYPLQRLAATDHVRVGFEVRTRPGARVVLAGLDVDVPAFDVEGLHVEGDVQIGPSASGASVRRSVVLGDLQIVGTQDVVIAGNRISPPCCNRVPLTLTASDPGSASSQVPRDIVIQGNDIGPAYASSDWRERGVHNEAVHLQAGIDVRFFDNLVRPGGTSASLSVSADTGTMRNVVVEGNHVAGCSVEQPPPGAVCDAHHALTTGAADGAGTITVRRNTVLGNILIYQPAVVSSSGNLATGGTQACDPLSLACAPVEGDRCDGADAAPAPQEGLDWPTPRSGCGAPSVPPQLRED